MTVSEKITDHPEFEPGTLALLAVVMLALLPLVTLGIITASNAKVPGSSSGWSVIFFADCHLCCVVE